MNWNVAIKADIADERLTAYLRGVEAGLYVAGIRTTMVLSGEAPLDVKFYLAAQDKAITLAKTIVEDLDRFFAPTGASVTLMIDARRLSGGTS